MERENGFVPEQEEELEDKVVEFGSDVEELADVEEKYKEANTKAVEMLEKAKEDASLAKEAGELSRIASTMLVNRLMPLREKVAKSTNSHETID